MFLSSQNRRELQANGWTMSQVNVLGPETLAEELRGIAAQLGKPVPARRGQDVVSMLRPTQENAARPHSLSANHSTGAFPYHIDTAHWAVPCRYLILGCVDPGSGNRRTTLVDSVAMRLSRQQLALLASSPLRIVNGRHSFFSTVVRPGRPYVRYDMGCMRAVTEDGKRAIAVFRECLQSMRASEVYWRSGDILIVDNWRVLHGRSDANSADLNRMLMRIYVSGDFR